LASLLLQVQVFFTVLLAVVFLDEKPSGWQIAGAFVAFSGSGFVAANPIKNRTGQAAKKLEEV
jgi:O-acetylserine/cysteine efflux transporter